MKLTTATDVDNMTVIFLLDEGSLSDSKILDKLLKKQGKLPYELFLDKGYENYERRRALKTELSSKIRNEEL